MNTETDNSAYSDGEALESAVPAATEEASNESVGQSTEQPNAGAEDDPNATVIESDSNAPDQTTSGESGQEIALGAELQLSDEEKRAAELAEEIAVSKAKIREAFESLSADSALVHLSGVKISNPEVQAVLVDGLRGLESLGLHKLEVHLVLCEIGDDGFRDLMMALPSTIEEISMKLGYNKLTHTGVTSLYPILKKQGMKIRVLDLDGNNMGPEGAQRLIKLIHPSVEIEDLNIRGNAIGLDGAAWISKGIFDKNLKILSLNLSDNGLGDEGMRILGQHLNKDGSKLQTLILKSNSIGAIGAATLAKALQESRPLASLDLDCNVIGDAGITAICEAIRFNSRISHLNVSDNNITEVGLRALTKHLSSHKNIGSLVLRRMSSNQKAMGPAGAAAIADLLSKNTSITSIE